MRNSPAALTAHLGDYAAHWFAICKDADRRAPTIKRRSANAYLTPGELALCSANAYFAPGEYTRGFPANAQALRTGVVS